MKEIASNVLFFCFALPMGIAFICFAAVGGVLIGGYDGFFYRRKGSLKGRIHGR